MNRMLINHTTPYQHHIILYHCHTHMIIISIPHHMISCHTTPSQVTNIILIHVPCHDNGISILYQSHHIIPIPLPQYPYHISYHTISYHTAPYQHHIIHVHVYHTITMAYNVSITYHTTPYQCHIIPMPPYPCTILISYHIMIS